MRIRPSSSLCSVLWCASAALLLDVEARAQSDAAVRDAVRACATQPRDAARLACYDAVALGVTPAARVAPSAPPAASPGAPAAAASTATGAPPSPPPPAVPPPSPAPQIAAAPAPPASADFGFPRQRATEADPHDDARQLVSSVTAIREIQPGRRLEITLANGQVWRQTSSDRYPLAVGHAVKIYPTRFGDDFRLAATKLRSFIQVERVR